MYAAGSIADRLLHRLGSCARYPIVRLEIGPEIGGASDHDTIATASWQVLRLSALPPRMPGLLPSAAVCWIADRHHLLRLARALGRCRNRCQGMLDMRMTMRHGNTSYLLVAALPARVAHIPNSHEIERAILSSHSPIHILRSMPLASTHAHRLPLAYTHATRLHTWHSPTRMLSSRRQIYAYMRSYWCACSAQLNKHTDACMHQTIIELQMVPVWLADWLGRFPSN